MSRCRSSMPRALLCVCFAAASIRTASAAAPWFDDDGDLGDAKAEANNNKNMNAPLPGENAALAEATVSAIASSHSTDWMANLSSPIDFEARDGQLFANGEPFYVKGANWFGSEGRTGPPGGLSAHTVGWYLDFLSANGFNAIRLLFNHESILGDGRISAAELSKAPELYGLSYLQMFRSIALQAGQRGIVVMMACHRLTPTAWPGSGLWFDEQIDEARVLESWDKIASTLCDVWSVFAVDLQNEPHAASWGFGRGTDWDRAAARLGNHVLEACPRWLVMVEGVGHTPGAPGGDDPSAGFWWGGNMVGAKVAPIALDGAKFQKRLVYSPHTYGPGVFEQPYFSDATFPANMADIWEAQWAFVAHTTGQPIVIGEMGGFYRGKDKVWMDWAIAYCIKHRIGLFYFGLNPTIDEPDGEAVDVEVPSDFKEGDDLLIGKTRAGGDGKQKMANAYTVDDEVLKEGGGVRVASIEIKVPESHPKGHDLYVGTHFGGVYSVQLPKGVKPGQRLTVQVAVHAVDETPESSAPAPPAALKKAASSTLSEVLDRMDQELALLDEEIANYYVAGLEEKSNAVVAGQVGIGDDGDDKGTQHVVVGKLVRHRTEKWIRQYREKSAWHDKRQSAKESGGTKEHPGRQGRRGMLGRAKDAMVKRSTRSRRRETKSKPMQDLEA